MHEMKPLPTEDVAMILSGLIQAGIAKREATGLAPDIVTAEEELAKRITSGALYIKVSE